MRSEEELTVSSHDISSTPVSNRASKEGLTRSYNYNIDTSGTRV